MLTIGIVILSVLFVAVVVLVILLRAELNKMDKNDNYRKYVSVGVMTPIVEEDVGQRILDIGNAISEARERKAENYCENDCPYRSLSPVMADDGSIKGEVSVCEKGWNRRFEDGSPAGVNGRGVSPNYEPCPEYKAILDGR
jgi:hypothetical protein